MKISKRYIIGIGFFGLAIGYLVGASNTPVVGATLGALVPLASALVSLFRTKEKEDNINLNILLYSKMVGIGLGSFSILLLAGLFLGEYHRRYDLFDLFKNKSPVVKNFPWRETADAPKELEETLFWINTSEKLTRLGYPNDSVQNLYYFHRKANSLIQAVNVFEIPKTNLIEPDIIVPSKVGFLSEIQSQKKNNSKKVEN